MLPTISIAAPAYNEGENIYSVVESWTRYLRVHFQPDAYEIVVCDDGSQDDTGQLLDELAREFPAVRRCRHEANQGAAAALTTAIQHTTKEWVLLIDTDGQYPIENLDAFLSELKETPEPAYIGFRLCKIDSMFARFGSWASGWCCNFFHGTRYRDFNCAWKLVEGRLLRDLCLEARGLNYSLEITSKILERGVVMKEIEVVHLPRAGGRSTRTLLRASLHRLLFVGYLGFRQFLFWTGTLQRRNYSPL